MPKLSWVTTTCDLQGSGADGTSGHTGPEEVLESGVMRIVSCANHVSAYKTGGWKPSATPLPGASKAKHPCYSKGNYSIKCKGPTVEFAHGSSKLTYWVCKPHESHWLSHGWKPTASAASSVKTPSKGNKKRKKGRVVKMQWWKVFEQLVLVSNRLMLVGPPGTGKSATSAIILGNAQRLTMTEGTGVEDLLGMFHLVKGETVWKDGPAARAMRGVWTCTECGWVADPQPLKMAKGYMCGGCKAEGNFELHGTALVLDEVDKYSPEVGSLLYALLDDDPQVTLPSGEHLRARQGYKVVATSNANVSALPEPILDRMEAIIIAAQPHPDAMAPLKADERAAVENYYRTKITDAVWKWSGTATLRRMRAYSKFALAASSRGKNKLQLDAHTIAEAVFGTSGKEIVSVLATAARTKEAL